jgi:hypothetical protein
MLLYLVKIAFRQFFEVILWINLALCAISGIMFGVMARSAGLAFLGLIGGLVIGAFLNVVCGGIIATLLNIDANLEKIAGGKQGGGQAVEAAEPAAAASVNE